MTLLSTLSSMKIATDFLRPSTCAQSIGDARTVEAFADETR